jgi:hypothetical protein
MKAGVEAAMSNGLVDRREVVPIPEPTGLPVDRARSQELQDRVVNRGAVGPEPSTEPDVSRGADEERIEIG